jgi:hypothetical protein
MAVKGAVISVGTTAVLLNPAPDSDNRDGSKLSIFNAGTIDIRIGGPDVTATANGSTLYAGTPYSETLVPGDLYYGILTSGSTPATVEVLQTGV